MDEIILIQSRYTDLRMTAALQRTACSILFNELNKLIKVMRFGWEIKYVFVIKQ